MEETVTHKGIIGILLAFIIMISMIAGAVSPANRAHAAEDYRTWSQKDERWASTAMGGSTVRDSGCYVTSIAMVVAASGARNTEDFNPGVFAQQLNSIGAFTWDGSLAYWASVNKVIPEVKIETANLSFKAYAREGKAAEMKEWLDKGYYVICNVGGHWVYVDSISGGDITMADPAKTETDLFSVYSDVYFYQVLSGKEPYGQTSIESTSTATTTSETTETTITTTKATTTAAATAKAATTTKTTATKAAATTTKTTVKAAATTTRTLATKSTTAALTTVESSAETTSTAKTTNTKATTTSTTTAAIPTTSADATAAASGVNVSEFPTGEYFCSEDIGTEIYADLKRTDNVLTEMTKGDIVWVSRVLGGWGCVIIDGTDAWVDLEKLTYAGEEKELISGDINGDGKADAIDLALLNSYIKNCCERPEGISTLRRCEITAADISCDGVINDTDVLMYLMLICE